MDASVDTSTRPLRNVVLGEVFHIVGRAGRLNKAVSSLPSRILGDIDMTDIRTLCSEMNERDRWWAKAIMLILTAKAKEEKATFTASNVTFSVTNEDYKETK